MRYDVFISYSSIDQKIAEGVCAYLEQQGIRCFVAYRDIPRGVVWATAIVEALENSRMMVVLFSKNFNDSSQVEREIELASDMEMPILTFRLSDVAFRGAKKYYLQNLNWIDAFPNPERSFGALYGNVASLLGIAVSGGGKGVKKDSPKSHESNKSNRFLWIVIACLSVALVVALVFKNEPSSVITSIDQSNVVHENKVESNNRVLSESSSMAKSNVVHENKVESNNRVPSESSSMAKSNVVQEGKVENKTQKLSVSDIVAIIKDTQVVKLENTQTEDIQDSKVDAKELYRKGLLASNSSESFRLVKEAAELGLAEAQERLGYYYETGKGVSKDLFEAFKWYKKSAEQGYADAQESLGSCYEYGKGVSKDLSEAFKWYKKSADQGNSIAQGSLGLFYKYGLGVSQDWSEAVKWYKKSAEQGFKYSQYELGECYEKGEGVSKDISEAKKWYKKAAEKGDADAKKALERLEKTTP